MNDTETVRTAKEAKAVDGYCEARTRKQMDTPYWGESKIGCSRWGIIHTDGHWACKQHSDRDKRYGWN